MMIEGQIRRTYKDSPPVSGMPQERGRGLFMSEAHGDFLGHLC